MLLRQSISTGLGNASALSSLSALHGARGFLPPLLVGSLGGRLQVHLSPVVSKEARAMAESHEATGTLLTWHSSHLYQDLACVGFGSVCGVGSCLN
jgi:hypothetical protein